MNKTKIKDLAERVQDHFWYYDYSEYDGEVDDNVECDLDFGGGSAVMTFHITGAVNNYRYPDSPPIRKENISLTCEKLVFYTNNGMAYERLTREVDDEVLSRFDFEIERCR